MRASQSLNVGRSGRILPIQRRLSAGNGNVPGLRNAARKSALPRARRVELAVAVTSGALLLALSFALSLL